MVLDDNGDDDVTHDPTLWPNGVPMLGTPDAEQRDEAAPDLLRRAAKLEAALSALVADAKRRPENWEGAEGDLIANAEGLLDRLPDPEPVRIAIVIEGGLVCGLVSNRPDRLMHLEVMTLDYDTEGADEDELYLVEQDDQTWEPAVVVKHSIGPAGIVLDTMKPLLGEDAE